MRLQIMVTSILIVSVASLILPRASATPSNDWPMYRGDPAHTGAVEGSAGGNWSLRWSFDAGSTVYSSPAVAYGTVFIGDAEGRFYALDATNAHAKWKFDAGWYHFQASPALDENGVYSMTRSKALDPWDHYVWDENGTLRAHDPATGAIRWSLTFDGDMFASPVVKDGHLVIGAGNRIVSVSTKSGTIDWTVPTSDAVYSTPAICGDAAIVPATDGTVYSVNLKDGSIRWNRNLVERFDSSPACHEGRVFVATYPGRVFGLEVATGKTLWMFDTDDRLKSSPSLDDRLLYVGSERGTFFAFDQATGRVVWTATASRIGLSSPALVGGILYVGGLDGRVQAISAKTGNVSTIFQANYIIEPSLAYADGTLYFGSRDHHVYALESEWHQTPEPTGRGGGWAPGFDAAIILAGCCSLLTFMRRRRWG